MTFMDKGSLSRSRELMKAFRNAVVLADDETTGEEVIAALAAVAGEIIGGQEDERAGHELLGMLNVATNIAILKFQGFNTKAIINA